MFRKLRRPIACLQLALVVFATGCAPVQPYFFHERGELAHYLDKATEIEYPEIDTPILDEVRHAQPPLTLDNHEYQLWDLTLEDCISIALQNADILKTIGGTQEQRQGVPAQILSSPQESLSSVYDVSLTSTTTQAFPITVDGNGNRTLPRGALRANQVGGVEDALAEFDAQVTGFLGYNVTDQPRNVQTGNPFNPIQFRARDTQQQLAISKRSATGGVSTLRQQTLYGWNNIEPNSIGRSVASEWTVLLEAQVQHPLMRNRGTLINRIPVMLAATNEDISIAEFEANVRNLVRDVENAYWDLYLAFQAVETERAGRDSSQVTARFAKVNLESGNGTEQEVSQAEGQYYDFEARLKIALAGSNLPGNDPLGVYGRERDLRFKMGLASTDGRLIRPITSPTVARVEFNWEEILPESMFRSPELRQQQYRIKQHELEMIAAKNQLLPDLDLSMTYRWRGTGDEFGSTDRPNANFPDRGSSALAELTEGDYQESAIRLDFTPPAIGARREKSRVRQAQLSLVRAERALQTKEEALANQLAEAVSDLKTHYRLVETYFLQWSAQEREVRARLAEYETGKSDVNVILQSQLRRAQAQLSYYRALTEYNKSVCYVHYLKGTLLDYNSITLSEGPWPQKAYWDATERARERDAGHYLNYGWTRPNVIRTGPVEQGSGSDAPQGPSGFISGDNGDGSNQEPTLRDPQPEEVPAPEPIQSTTSQETARAPVVGSGVQRTSFSTPQNPQNPVNPFRS